MQKRTLKVAILAALTIVLVFSMGAAALGQTSQFTDLNASITGQYDITLEQVSAISDVQSGLFRPYADITRAEYAVMAVNAFDIPLVNPATPSFPDVPKTHPQYMYIEAAYAAGVVMGYTDGTFGPGNTATRQQQLSMISRYVGGKAGYYSAGVWNWRTADEINALVAHFGDAASIDPAHKTAVAFAYAMGITKGNNFGNLAPVANVIRIQSAAMLIRSQALVPWATAYPAEVMLVSADKSENLIGKTHTLKFKVLDAGGHPAKGALVDFDTLYANPYYVGNISPQAAVTDAFGEVSVNLLSAEPGTQRVSATINTINGPATTMATKYWLAMDEIYILDEERWAENNAGTAHEWCARVVVIGPGPRSTSQFDWYNVIDEEFDPADLQTDDGRWESLNDYGDELTELDDDEMPRTMAGIGVEWTVDWTDLADPSKGVIVAKDDLTDADGIACITINSTSIGEATVQAMAWYPENPYPQMLLDRDTADASDWVADDDWEQQPKAVASATKLWIPHIIGGDSDAPITPTYAVNNTGEVEEFVLELKDVYGNPIEDYQVEWWIQGVGFFKTDESTWVGVGEQNKDIDETDADGMASVLVKSEDAGQTIVHCKVMDKYGLPWKEWNVVKQWYAVDFVTMDNPLTPAVDESVATNPVGTSHTFDVWALGWKYVYVLTDVNHNGLRDDAVLLGDRNDIKALSGDVLNFDGVTVAYTKGVGEVLPAGRVIRIKGTLYTNYTDASAIDEAIAWVDSIGDDVKEAWHPLQGKGVNFFTNVGMGGTPTSDTALATVVPGAPAKPYYVGSITGAAAPYPEWTYGGKLYDYDAVTDAGGKASVTITSTAKGSQWVYAVVDYPQNPQGGDPTKPTKWAELNWDSAVKTWTAGAGTTIRVFNAAGDPGNEFTNPILPYVRLGIDDINTPPNGESRAQLQPMVYGMFRGMDFDNPNREVIAVQIFDAYGNSVEGWKVDFQIVDQGKTLTTGKVPTYRPFTHFAEWDDSSDYDWVTPNWPDAGVGDLGPFVDTNPIWNALQDEHWYSDDDYSWGHTRNGEINYNETLASAAYTTLILDQSIAELSKYDHVATKVNVKVWNPDGKMVEDFQVEKTWEVPVPTTITIDPTADYAIAGVESQSVVATVLDQFGNPVVDATLDIDLTTLEGTLSTEADTTAGPTNAQGKVTFTWSQSSGDWGVQTVVAKLGTLASNTSTIQWIYDDRSGVLLGLDLVEAVVAQQKVNISAGITPWNGRSLTVHMNPGAAAIGGPVAYTGVETSISTGAKTWTLSEPFFVKANSTDTDGKPNWVYDRTDPGAVAVLGIESAPDGSGTEISDRTIPAGDSFTVYVVGRDEFGNFVGNIAPDAWSLINVTGLVDPVVPGDLVVAPDGKSATFTGRGVGTCQIQATIAGLDTNVTGTVTVVPGQLDHFGFATISSPQTAGSAFAITVTAYDAYNNVKTDYVGSAGLSLTGNTISPTTTGAFTAGVRSGLDVTITSAQGSAVITATDGAATGSSNSFEVQAAPITFQSLASATSTGTGGGETSALTINKPSGTVSGDLLLAEIAFNQGSDVVITVPTGWVLVDRRNVGGDDYGQAIYRKIAGGSEPATYTWTIDYNQTEGRRAVGAILRYTGVNTASPITVFSANSATSGTTLTASAITAPAKSMVVALYGIDTSTALSNPAGMNDRVERQHGDSGGPTLQVSDLLWGPTAGSTGNKLSTAGSSNQWAAHLVALNPAP